MDGVLPQWVIPDGIEQFIARHRPDELLVTANIFDHEARLHSFSLLAEAAGLR